MAFPNETVGTVVSAFPTAIVAITAQTETNDPPSPDPDIAEGKDANRWSAEIHAMQRAAKKSGRGFVKINDPTGTPTADIASLNFYVDDVIVTLAALTGVALTPSVTNYIFVSFVGGGAPVYVVTTSGVLADTGNKMIPIATWDGSSTEATDLRSDIPVRSSVIVSADATPGGGLAGQDIRLRPGKGDGAGAHGGWQFEHKQFGGFCKLRPKSVVLTGSGATVTVVGAIPMASTLFGATVRVLVSSTGTATSFSAGIPADPTMFGTGMAITAGTTNAMGSGATMGPGPSGPKHYGAGAIDVLITAAGGTFTGISVRVVLWYLEWGAPTS